MTDNMQRSSYLDHLPAIFHEDPFLGPFLLAFERILSRAAPLERPALEQVIDQIDRYFRPVDANPARRTPTEFLPWLAGWVSLSLREDWDESTKREFIQNIVPLYRKRGTKAGLRQMLEIYLGGKVPITIYDNARDFGFEPPAHFFQVQITINDRDPVGLQRTQQIAMSIIEQEKPAHTFYALQVLIPTMRLMSEELLAAEDDYPPLILGDNTLLGTQNSVVQ